MINRSAATPQPAQAEKGYLTVRFNPYRIIFAAIIIFTIITRLYGLSFKPYHHDESLYATYSWYLYEGRGYKYDPMMHGPFMFYLDALLFTLFSPNDFTARLSSALFGIALVCCVGLLRRQLGSIGTLVAAGIFAVSPTFMYFSRFFREDIFVAFWAFLTMALFLNYLDTQRRGYLYGAAAALAFVFCVKENSYLFLFIFSTFISFAAFYEILFHRGASRRLYLLGWLPGALAVGVVWFTAAPHWALFSVFVLAAVMALAELLHARKISLTNAGIGLGIFMAIFYVFFTSFFRNKPGFVDGLAVKSLSYWINQDKIQRIKDAFTYFCPLAIVYELPLLVILFSGLAALLCRRRLSRIVLITSSIIAIPLLLIWHRDLPIDPWDTKLHMTSTIHIVFTVYMFALLFAAVCHYLKDQRPFPAFLAYWGMLSVLIYSYAGEK
ncbi:MAG: TIGR03663 family protein, partial [Candidatus Aureabacteria bacterium]|nr:TIGR03663 family protein [Candidatus Auribacterota bacterium]